MDQLVIDIETYSSADLTKCGVYKYAESPDFEILLFGYSLNGEPVKVVDIARGEIIPSSILSMLSDKNVIKVAFNCNFERICLSRFLGMPTGTFLSPISWHDTMILALYNGLPRSLKQVGEVLNLTDKKMDEGKDLIRYFCVPCKPTISNGGRTRNYPFHAPDKWALMVEYNKRDVVAEMEIEARLAKYQVPDLVWEEFYQDQLINDRGIEVDVKLVDKAIELDEETRSVVTQKMKDLTDLENPNSVSQLKDWLLDKGFNIDTLGKKDVDKFAAEFKGSNVGQMMEYRKMLSKSSVKKYYAMKEALCSDNRIRGMFMFYAARTGRFCSKIVQLQNLPRNEIENLDEARMLAIYGTKQAFSERFSNVPDILSQLVRTAFIAHSTRKFIVADFSAIECRVLAWLAGEKWVLDAFADGQDIYCATAEKMFHVPVVKHGINGELRQKGKAACLSCGYQGGPGALIAMGALDSGMKEEELKPLVDSWRAANPHIVKFWSDIDKAIKYCIRNKASRQVGKVRVECRNGMLFIYLPSGRRLSYAKPSICVNKFGSESFCYWGLDMSKKWVKIETFGGKIVENITQAVARDLLVNSMMNLKDYDIVAHIHDELIIETSEDTCVDLICKKMAEVPDWAEGLILRADGYETKYYKKD